MHTLLFVFEFLGTTELMVIALVALILFGPRKLPEIGRSVGKSIAEFKRASDDFKRTWEFEVELEQRKSATETEVSAVATPPAGELGEGGAQVDADGEPVARTPGTWAQEDTAGGAGEESGTDAATAHAQNDTATGHAQNAAPVAPADGGEISHADGVKTSPAGEDENKAS
jgi:sec-independent protein translocase protein TatA